jgi:hypothetical protein
VGRKGKTSPTKTTRQEESKMKIAPELKPILDQLHKEGHKVYTYESDWHGGEINSLFWFEGGRVLNIQPTTWFNHKHLRDVYRLGVCYIPSRKNGSGCGLSPEDGFGTSASEILKYRNALTWVRGVKNYPSMEAYLKKQTILKYFEVE